MQQELTAGNLKKAMSESGSKSRDLWFVPIADIHIIEGFNVRDDNDDYKAHIRSLADSIKVNGFMSHKPLAAYIERKGDENFIRLTDGHSRLAAAKLAISEGCEITTLPVVAHPSGTDMADLIAGLATNNSGKPLKPIELAAVCKRLQSYGLEVAQIAERLSVTSGYVASLLTLIGAPKAIREMVSKGEVSASTAITTLRQSGDVAEAVLSGAMQAAKTQGKGKVTPASLKQPKAAEPYATACKWVYDNTDAGTREALFCARLLASMFDKTPYGVDADILSAR